MLIAAIPRYDGNLIEPKPAWEHYIRQLNLFSVGVMGITKAECALLGLSALPNPEPIPEHAVIDFSHLAGQ
ncbi:MAG: hypothetical protein HQL56_19560 [Magnetococcales bacterium]|nr:hypothetical protein [Magnetococcales bacterium]